MKILLIEDSKEIADMLIWSFKDYSVTHILNPTLLPKNEHFDLIITDFQMPEMTGLQFTERYCQREDAAPVLMYSGTEGIARTFVELGGEQFFLKDIDGFKQLKRAVFGYAQALHKRGSK